MGDRGTDFVRDLVGEDQRALLMTACAEAPAAAGKGDQDLVVAVVAADAGEAGRRIAAAQKPPDRLADGRPPVSVAPLVPLGIDPLEVLVVAIDQLIQGRLAWPARAIDSRLGDGADHGETASPCPARWLRGIEAAMPGCVNLYTNSVPIAIPLVVLCA